MKNDAVERAKEWVEKEYPSENRRWLKKKINSYSSNNNRVEIWVYEGSPAKGVVVASWDLDTLFFVVAINCWGVTKRFTN